MIFEATENRPQGPRPFPIGLSLAVHGALLVLLAVPGNLTVKRTPSAYDQLIKGKESKIVFYRFKDKLPDVKPVQRADSRPPKAEVKIAKQSIVSSPRNSPKGKQMVWTPLPEVKTKPDTAVPNILALQMPAAGPPEPAPRKKFEPPAPVLQARTAKQVPEMAAAPELKTSAAPVKALDSATGALSKLTTDNRPRFQAPQARARTVVATPRVEAAPPPAASSSVTANPAVQAQMQRALADLHRPAAEGPAFSTAVQKSELNIAAVGLNPNNANALPTTSRATEFSAGPKLNPDGGAGGANKGAVLTVPDLMVNGGGNVDTKPSLLARVAPTSPEALRGLARSASLRPNVPPSSAMKVANAPNPRFEGREVYTMAIQMANITSYVGSWLMWYADRGSSLLHAGPVSPPVPHRKVDPKYVASAVAERIEGRVQLLCVIRNTGHVDQVELVKGIDERLNQSAMEALRKWEFTPATRAGVPVDVDVMVEIPFRLAPRAAK